MFKTPPVPEPVHLDGFASGAVRGPVGGDHRTTEVITGLPKQHGQRNDGADEPDE